MRNFLRRHNQVEAPTPPTLESQLADLDEEERRWEGFIEGTSIETAVILRGLSSVSERRTALLEPQDPSTDL